MTSNIKAIISLFALSLRHASLIGLVILLGFVSDANTQQNTYKYSDTAVKAAYLHNIISFVQFPESTAEQRKICIVGDDLVGITLAQILNTKSNATALPEVLKLDYNSSFKPCDLMFVGQNRKDFIRNILYKTESLNVLTISDVEGFNQMGGMIEFLNIKSRIRLGINLTAAKAANIHISSKLLNIAYKVHK